MANYAWNLDEACPITATSFLYVHDFIGGDATVVAFPEAS